MRQSSTAELDMGPVIERVNCADPETLLARLADEGWLAEGRAHIIGLDAVRTVLGRRWDDRRAMVMESVATCARRLLAPEDTCAPVGDADVLIICPAVEPMVARGLAAHILCDVLAHFLGEARSLSLKVKMVEGFAGGQAVCRTLDTDAIETALAATANRTTATGKDGAAYANGLLGEPITTFDGRRLRISFAVDPIIDLGRMAVAGHRIEPRLLYTHNGAPMTPVERMGLLASDMERVDLATLERGLSRLAGQQDRGEHPSLILAVSFLTASSQRARTKLMLRLGDARERVKSSVIWEITDLPDGAPAGRLTEMAALLRPFGRAVFAQTTLSGVAVKAARAARIGGLLLQPQKPLENESDSAVWLLQAGKMVRGAAPALIAANLPGAALLPTAAAAGFTHATVRTAAA